MTDRFRGELFIFTGPMFSGKTSRLLNELSNEAVDRKCLYINHSIDTRTTDPYSCHNIGVQLPDKVVGIKTAKLGDVNVSGYSVVAVDEAQFYERDDLVETILRWVNLDKKTVYVAGLHADSNGREFGHILRLVPQCTNCVFLTAYCRLCRKRDIRAVASFSARFGDSTDKQLLVGADEYIPLCRHHFFEHVNSSDLRVSTDAVDTEIQWCPVDLGSDCGRN